ncbi:Cyclin-dependent kinase inhibitor [Caenorhabditis elegans]|uniref:Cyclin-dependent kinase inhibitor n=1 Tax=Caenorhabditis elegans TaxID=6239 RepID=A4UVL0_CAEEL|nr:Cyclin-dependent kinase inhibitor [Caenorhabditis elegans]CAM84694.1 Cyclin-dependent kinase inhibitor [Caenorhabditis elegans]|eukprot:NP_001123013.1 Uncharacterized protein CELE_T10G3.8 [Caenorhabditis elegans]
MNINELVHGMNGISLERGMKHQDSETSEHHERGHLTRKSSTTSSTGSLHVDKKKHLFRKDSEVKMEAIFKELFSPDAKIVDHFDGEMLMIPGIELEDSKNEDSLLISNHDRFKLRRQTSLVPKNEVKKNASPQPRVRVITRKSPSPLRKLSTPTQRKRSSSSKAPLPKLSAPPSLKPNFVTVADESLTAAYLRKNPIPLRRGVSIPQK